MPVIAARSSENRIPGPFFCAVAVNEKLGGTGRGDHDRSHQEAACEAAAGASGKRQPTCPPDGRRPLVHRDRGHTCPLPGARVAFVLRPAHRAPPVRGKGRSHLSLTASLTLTSLWPVAADIGHTEDVS